MMGTVNQLQVIPLGGLGEFGLNMMALRWQDEIILIDCGKMFPEDKHFGIEAVIPDFAFIRDNIDKVKALFLTHGHEDHIGAVPYLLKVANIPVYGTPLTLGLTRHRLKEHRLHRTAQLNTVNRGGIVDLDSFSVHFVGVSHGIPDSCALAVTTPVGVAIHTGDFKIDQTPLDDQIFDYHTLAGYGRDGVLLLLSDSTNVEVPGYTFSERDVYDGFLKIFTEAQGKILVASFASHFHRMQQIIDLAEEFGRKVAFCGRSMEQNSRLAKELGYLDVPHGMEIGVKDVKRHRAEELVVIATGSQAEPTSALTKIALDLHPHVKLNEGDVVALSARKIPGNERSISSLINHLYRRGAEVIHDGVMDIHASGHGCRQELKMMLNIVSPKFFMPVHGEFRQLHLHAQTALAMGMPEESVLLAESGQVVSVGEDSIEISGDVEVGHVLIDSSQVDEVDENALHDRRILAQEGVIMPIVVVALKKKTKVVNFQFLTKALSSESDVQDVLAKAEGMIISLVEESSIEECRDEELMKARIGKAIRKYLMKELKIRPMILPVIMEI